MAITFYCGAPGSGKSYHVVKEVIIPTLIEGRRKILTNLPVKLEVMASEIPELKYVQSMDLLQTVEEDKIQDIHEIVDHKIYAGYLIVIDEAHIYWPTSDPIKNKGFRSWITQHRHLYQDFVLVTQEFENVNKFIRSLTYNRYEFSKNEDKGFKNGYNQDYFLGKSKKKSKREFLSYDSFYYQFYHSHSQGLAGRGFVEKRVGKKVNLLFRYWVFIGVGALFVVFSFYSLLTRWGSQLEAVENIDETQLAKNTSIVPPKIKGKDSSRGISVQNSNFKVGAGIGAGNKNRTASFSDPNNDWCLNVVNARAGVGSNQTPGTRIKFRNGREEYLSGAHEVVGIIGVGSTSIYLFRSLKGSLIKGTIQGGLYSVGQKVCL